MVEETSKDYSADSSDREGVCLTITHKCESE